MMGNHKKNEKPCSRRTQCSNEYIWWRKSENGFTLAELLIVVAIIGKRSVLAERANLLP